MSESKYLTIFKKALLVPPVLFFLFVVTSIIFRLLGGCTGGLGSGIKCSSGDFIEGYASLAEILLIIAAPAAVIYTIICIIALWLGSKYL